MGLIAVWSDLGWHTVNDTVMSYGEALVDDDPGRYGSVCWSQRHLAQTASSILATLPPDGEYDGNAVSQLVAPCCG